ncbi:SDR family NAD(P)-dependent oxidoreductase [Paracoccus sp. YIM 132242]|uniref:SDR family NAD(P)-dependent oxidoreductase n=2 Tax=Paracoccus lichenicola TaxID=2665644 RepID=A0A6L6HTA0_9RHOB|nr:SDR family NAD(P)-dependent oxidoreductase [Paracoccus lichenicola]
MALQVPGALDHRRFWTNLRDGVESITRLSPEQLLERGEAQARIADPRYVPAAAILEGFDSFDADFFGLSPKDAAIMDPQHRKFLECCWQAIEDAGHRPESLGPTGVFGGCGMGSYFYFNVMTNRDLVDNTGTFLLRHTGNDKDFLSTRVSHVFDLRGPSINVQTACSTSLVAVHQACQSLLNGECDAALAGGVTIELPHGRGYLYNPNEILSPDGHCHAFDHRAQGTVFGSGASVVLLRRLEDAVRDRDHVWAVIKGTAVNNDGADKAGYLAPSVGGQAQAVVQAHHAAGIGGDGIDYVECHGTGTALGDPIEVAALTDAFARTARGPAQARIGSVKTNIGHLDTAAGGVGLIKVALSLHHGEMPPSLGYEAPNPVIDFEASPFAVNDRLTPWPDRGRPRRAAVNSLGVGGTNAHAVIEAAPAREDGGQSDWPFQLLVLSGRNRAALDGNAAALAAHLRANPRANLADVAWTLKEGRRPFDKRRVLVARDAAEAAELLEAADTRRVFNHDLVAGGVASVAFLFPGGGAQYAGMARDLYATEPEFRDWMDKGLGALAGLTGTDPRPLWLPEPGHEAGADAALTRPSVQLPLLFITEYALARLFMSWGVQPSALGGHSMGENTAACLAGVFSFEDGIRLVLLRGQLFDRVPAGGMLSVSLPAAEAMAEAGEGLDLAAVNGPALSVLSGPLDRVDALQAALTARGIECQRIAIDIAAHSRMLEPMLDEWRAFLRSIPLSAPAIPVVSNRTGTWLTADQATDPEYWVAHLRGTVDFAACAATLKQDPARVILEAGPGRAMSALSQANGFPANRVVSALRHRDDAIADDRWFVTALGRLWATGAPVDWTPLWGEAARNRVPLPTYAFQSRRYFIEASAPRADEAADLPMRREDLAGWGWRPAWRQSAPDVEIGPDGRSVPADGAITWLVFVDESDLGQAVADRLRAHGQSVIEVVAGDGYAELGPDRFQISPELGRRDVDLLVAALMLQNRLPDRVAHLWLADPRQAARAGSSLFHRHLEQGFYSLLYLLQALADEGAEKPLQLVAVTTGALAVADEPVPFPENALAFGPVGVGPRELDWLTARLVDVDAAARKGGTEDLADRLAEDLLAGDGPPVAAWRGGRRFARTWVHAPLPEPVDQAEVPEGAVVLITGGLGGIGLTLGADLARRRGARLALLSRTPLPPEAEWDGLVAADPGSTLALRLAALRDLRRGGAEVIVVSGDVADRESLAAAVTVVERRLGPVAVLLHAAGHVDDGPLLTRTEREIEDVFAAKVHGSRALLDVFAARPLALTVLFSSTSTAIAPAGQVDYVAANEYLNALALARPAAFGRTVAVNWGIWADTGMAAAALSRRDRDARGPVAGLPLLRSRIDGQGATSFEGTLSTGDWIVGEHRFRASGDALLPGTGVLEIAAEAVAAAGGQAPYALEDVTFLSPFAVGNGESRGLRITLVPDDDGQRFDILGTTGDAGTRLRTATGRITGTGAAAADRVDLAALAARMPREVGDRGHPLRLAQEDVLDFGPRWRVLRSYRLGASEGLARLCLSEAAQADLAAGWILHPALMDIATGWAMELIEGWSPQSLWVPVSYERVVVRGPLPARIVSWVRNADRNHAEDGFARFDITIASPDGEVLVEARGLTLRLIGNAADVLSARGQLVRDPAADAEQDPGRRRLLHNLSQGIPQARGPEAFRRALAARHPVLAVSSMDLAELKAEAEAASRARAPADGAPGFERPDLGTAMVEPRSDLERALAGYWRDLLGVSAVGVEDSFFDLGGHSLLAVRLFAMIRRNYGADLPISTLFQAPTIAQIAARIVAETGIDPASGEQASERPRLVAVAPASRFTHLVPMNGGAPGPGLPFFIVAGMFGNVLNLRSLAQRLSADRPVYGLQARGLYGEDAPHDSFADAAASCIAEMRQVQPQGPWLVGGFSGGGLTALEIARQLDAAGEDVGRLILLDTPIPLRPALSRRDRLLIRLGEMREQKGAFLGEYLRKRRAWKRELRRRAAGQAQLGAQSFHNDAIHAAFLAALPGFPMQVWDGPVTLYRPRLDRRWKVSQGRWVSTGREYVSADNDWGPWLPRLEVSEVPGDHDSMVLEPSVRILAARIAQQLKAVDARDRGADRLLQGAA